MVGGQESTWFEFLDDSVLVYSLVKHRVIKFTKVVILIGKACIVIYNQVVAHRLRAPPPENGSP